MQKVQDGSGDGSGNEDLSSADRVQQDSGEVGSPFRLVIDGVPFGYGLFEITQKELPEGAFQELRCKELKLSYWAGIRLLTGSITLVGLFNHPGAILVGKTNITPPLIVTRVGGFDPSNLIMTDVVLVKTELPLTAQIMSGLVKSALGA